MRHIVQRDMAIEDDLQQIHKHKHVGETEQWTEFDNDEHKRKKQKYETRNQAH